MGKRFPISCTLCLATMTIAVNVFAADAGEKDGDGWRAINVRYGVRYDAKAFGQDSPQATIRSVVKAIDRQRFDYLLAHLVHPEEVDARLAGQRAAFDQLVASSSAEKSARMRRALEKHLDIGRWVIKGPRARCTVDGAADLTLERLDGRWYMHNVPRPPPPRNATTAHR